MKAEVSVLDYEARQPDELWRGIGDKIRSVQAEYPSRILRVGPARAAFFVDPEGNDIALIDNPATGGRAYWEREAGGERLVCYDDGYLAADLNVGRTGMGVTKKLTWSRSTPFTPENVQFLMDIVFETTSGRVVS